MTNKPLKPKLLFCPKCRRGVFPHLSDVEYSFRSGEFVQDYECYYCKAKLKIYRVK